MGQLFCIDFSNPMVACMCSDFFARNKRSAKPFTQHVRACAAASGARTTVSVYVVVGTRVPPGSAFPAVEKQDLNRSPSSDGRTRYIRGRRCETFSPALALSRRPHRTTMQFSRILVALTTAAIVVVANPVTVVPQLQDPAACVADLNSLGVIVKTDLTGVSSSSTLLYLTAIGSASVNVNNKLKDCTAAFAGASLTAAQCTAVYKNGLQPAKATTLATLNQLAVDAPIMIKIGGSLVKTATISNLNTQETSLVAFNKQVSISCPNLATSVAADVKDLQGPLDACRSKFQ
ncbi:hypothetical protein C8F01DRAFT_1380642 [Mycena amicta]|nr:hypothetical protein C8F01DRAFT_1380642 [Mycena amicta]